MNCDGLRFFVARKISIVIGVVITNKGIVQLQIGGSDDPKSRSVSFY